MTTRLVQRPVRRFRPLLMIAAGINLAIGLASLALLVLSIAALSLGTLASGESQFTNDDAPALAVLCTVGVAALVSGGALITQSSLRRASPAKPIGSMVITAALDGVIVVVSALWAANTGGAGQTTALVPALTICSCGAAVALIVIASGID
jgi:hypothetical protein